MSLTFKVVLRKDGIAVCCVDKVDLLLQPNTLVATIFLHLHMSPSLQALDAFAAAFSLHTIDGHNRFRNSSDELVTWRDLGGKNFRSVFVDNVSDVSVNNY